MIFDVGVEGLPPDFIDRMLFYDDEATVFWLLQEFQKAYPVSTM